MYGADQLFGIWCDIGDGTTSRIVGEFSNWNASDDREVEWLIVDLRSAYSSVRLIMGQCTQPARTEDDTDHSHGCTPWCRGERRGLVVVGRCIKTRPRSIIRNPSSNKMSQLGSAEQHSNVQSPNCSIPLALISAHRINGTLMKFTTLAMKLIL